MHTLNEDQSKEYNNLRNEINTKVSYCNNMVAATITVCITLWTFAIENHTAILFFISYLFVIIPISIQVMYYRSVIAKIAAYLIVFLENDESSYQWETRNSNLPSKKRSIGAILQRPERYLPNFQNFIFPLLGIANYALIVYYYWPIDTAFKKVCVVVLFVVLVLEIIFAKKTSSMAKMRNAWKDDWSKLK